MKRRLHKNHSIFVIPVFEPVESRPRILWYRYEIRYNNEAGLLGESEGFESEDQAYENACQQIAAWEVSL